MILKQLIFTLCLGHAFHCANFIVTSNGVVVYWTNFCAFEFKSNQIKINQSLPSTQFVSVSSM